MPTYMTTYASAPVTMTTRSARVSTRAVARGSRFDRLSIGREAVTHLTARASVALYPWRVKMNGAPPGGAPLPLKHVSNYREIVTVKFPVLSDTSSSLMPRNSSPAAGILTEP